jgi:hypothetical protein
VIISSSVDTRAPNASAIFIAARESLQNEGFLITVVPDASSPAAIALCVRLLLAGAVILPLIVDGWTVTFI